MAVLFGVEKCLSSVLFAKRFLNLGQLVTSMTNFTHAKVTLIELEHDKQSCISVVFKNEFFDWSL